MTEHNAPSARKAATGDAPAAAAALASAFAHDPVFCWMSGQPDTERRMTPFWRSLVRLGLRQPDHEIYVTADGDSVAVWRGIDDWKVPVPELLRSAPAMMVSLRHRLPVAMRLLSRLERVHPREPHYYLEFLGTRKDRQGKGGGSAVIGPMLERCDAEGVAAYLESSNPRNVPFYARHGFVEREQVAAPGGGPTLTPMWRDPRG